MLAFKYHFHGWRVVHIIPKHSTLTTLTIGGFGFDSPVGTMRMNAQTSRTAAGHPPVRTPPRDNDRFPPPTQTLLPQAVFMRSLRTSSHALDKSANGYGPCYYMVPLSLGRGTRCTAYPPCSSPACKWIWMLAILCTGMNASSSFSELGPQPLCQCQLRELRRPSGS